MAVFTLADLLRRRWLVTYGPAKPSRRAKFSISPNDATTIVTRVRSRAAAMLITGLVLATAFGLGVQAATDGPIGTILLTVVLPILVPAKPAQM